MVSIKKSKQPNEKSLTKRKQMKKENIFFYKKKQLIIF
jgi:hypothetical protein